MEEREQRARRHHKVRLPQGKTLLLFALVVIAAMGVLFSPIFAIDTITITGLSHFSEADICQICGLEKGQNLFSFRTKKAVDALKKESYIESVQMEKQFPNAVNIDVTERKVRGYIPYMGSYLYIDENCRVLEINGAFTQPLPVVKGLVFDQFTLGEVIETENSEALDVVVRIAQAMTKYEMLDMVVELDVSDTSNIKAFVNQVEVNLGTISDYDTKVRTMCEIVKQIPENDRGTLDLSDLSKPIVFKYLT